MFLLQYSQNRDTRAIQLKLDELIRSLGDARTHLVRLEQMSDEELDELEGEFHRLRDENRAAIVEAAAMLEPSTSARTLRACPKSDQGA